ncbi:hypothetical protein AX17_003596 [Amanita inopinata Kibby_2008]|nr:hypothetical protein AX17_003596 [Amanita inopinata Kibby_2008]
MEACYHLPMPLTNGSSASFRPDVAALAESSTSSYNVCHFLPYQSNYPRHLAQGYNMTSASGLYPPVRPPLHQRRSGVKIFEEQGASDSVANDAIQQAYEIMQHRNTIQRIANVFAA